MFFEEHEKKIYTPEGSTKQYDPLAVDRALKLSTGGKLAQLVNAWKAADEDTGDVSEDGVRQKIALSCVAEEALAQASREAFGLPEFPECTDGVALETLCDYLDWLKKKGTRGSTPPDSTTSAADTQSEPTRSS